MKEKGRKEGKKGKVYAEKIPRRGWAATCSFGLCSPPPPSPHQPRLRKKVRPKEIPDRNPGEGRAAGPRGRSLHETVAHRDAQKSVHSSNQRFLK